LVKAVDFGLRVWFSVLYLGTLRLELFVDGRYCEAFPGDDEKEKKKNGLCSLYLAFWNLAGLSGEARQRSKGIRIGVMLLLAGTGMRSCASVTRRGVSLSLVTQFGMRGRDEKKN